MGIGAERDAEGTSQTEVGNLEVPSGVDEEILGFEIAVEDAVGVAVFDTGHELMGELLDLCEVRVSSLSFASQYESSYHVRTKSKMTLPHRAFWQWLASASLTDRQRLHVLLEIQVQEFEDEIELVSVCVHDIEETDDGGIVHLLEK